MTARIAISRCARMTASVRDNEQCQEFGEVSQNGCSDKFRNIPWKVPLTVSFFSTSSWMFPEHFSEPLWAAIASDAVKQEPLSYDVESNCYQ